MYKVFHLRSIPIFHQLLLEELLLRCTNHNCLIYNTHVQHGAIVMGFSGKPLELLNINNVVEDDIPVIRRYTGGGTVYIDQNTVFTSLLMNNESANCQPYPREIMQWASDKIFAPSFSTLVSQVNDHSNKNSRNDSDHGEMMKSKFELLENDFVWNDKKIAGNAQSIVKGRWVHHTSFLWDFDPMKMQRYLTLPKKRPEYRRSRTHGSFLAPIHSLLPSFDPIAKQGEKTPINTTTTATNSNDDVIPLTKSRNNHAFTNTPEQDNIATDCTKQRYWFLNALIDQMQEVATLNLNSSVVDARKHDSHNLTNNLSESRNNKSLVEVINVYSIDEVNQICEEIRAQYLTKESGSNNNKSNLENRTTMVDLSKYANNS